MKHVKFHLINFLRRVRIHGGEFDTSARAMYRNEVVLPLQAEPRIVRGSTIERKQMSTKTTFKRVALVAVAAMGFGLLSVVPSNSAVLADSFVNGADGSSAVSTTVTVGTEAKALVMYSGLATSSADTATVSGVITAIPAFSSDFQVTFDTDTTASANNTNIELFDGSNPTGSVIAAVDTGRFTAYLNAKFTPNVAGTYSILLRSANGVSNKSIVWTITASAPTAVSAGFSKAWLTTSTINGGGVDYATAFSLCTGADEDGNGGPNQTAADAACAVNPLITTNAPVATTPSAAGNIVASIAVYLRNAPASVVTPGSAAAPITVSITGPGYVGIGNKAVWAKSITESSATAGADGYGGGVGGPANALRKNVFVKSDGTTGVSTISIFVGTTLIAERKVTFYGTASKAVATGVAKVLNSAGAPTQGAISVLLTDSNGNGVANAEASITGTSSDKTVLADLVSGSCAADADSVVGTYLCTVTSVSNFKSGGSATITLTVKSGSTVLATALPISFKLGGLKAASLELSAPTTSMAGEKVTITLTAKDADGNAVADGERQYLSLTEISTNTLGTLSPFSAATEFVNGVATSSFYAPQTGKVTMIHATVAENVASALALTKYTTVIAIENPAITAAEDATAAAEDAADAAAAAGEAALEAQAMAEAAVDAVAVLSAKITTLIKNLRAQITALTKLINSKLK